MLITLSTYFSYFTPGWEAGAEYLEWEGPEGFRYDAVSLGHPTEHNPWMDQESWPQIVAYLKEHRVLVASLHAPIEPDFDLTSPRPETCRRTMESHLTAARFAHLLIEEGLAPEGRLVQVVHLSENRAERLDNLVERIRIGVDNWRELIGRVERECPGVWLALENLPGNQPREELVEGVVEELGGEVWLCLDTGHLRLDPSGEEKLERLAARSIACHLQDNEGESDSHHLAMLSDQWIRRCLEALRESEHFYLVIQEHRGDRASVDETLREAARVRDFLVQG